jgi:hypothetical protein
MIHALNGIVDFVDSANKNGVNVSECFAEGSVENVLQDARKVLATLIKCRDGLPNDTVVKH